ncbi:MAG: hypothetical protein HKM24_03835 [Gammaproteobacteria bacterium]|nr:hypothetical protein [Gammaproteobacteria bacterium]
MKYVKKISAGFLLFVAASNAVLAADNLVYEADLNNDGIMDSISSVEIYGSAVSDYFKISISQADGEPCEKIIQLHPKAAVLELSRQGNRLWRYLRGSARSGTLIATSLDGSFAEESMILTFDGEETPSQAIYDTLFTADRLLPFKHQPE